MERQHSKTTTGAGYITTWRFKELAGCQAQRHDYRIWTSMIANIHAYAACHSGTRMQNVVWLCLHDLTFFVLKSRANKHKASPKWFDEFHV